MAFTKNILIPLIEIVFIGGIGITFGYFLTKGISNAWSKSLKYTIKYSILKKPYPEYMVTWISDCITSGIGWYDAKKILIIAMKPKQQVDEIMWIFDKIIKELNREKGGVKHGRNYQRGNRKDEDGKEQLPTFN